MELRKIVPVTRMAENYPVLYGNDLGIVKLPIRKQLSTDDNIISTKVTTGNAPSSIGHPPHSSASPIELRLRVRAQPRALSGKKKEVMVK